MRNRPARRAACGPWSVEELKARNLLSSGPIGFAPVLEDLGAVSTSAALRGVEATAAIAPGGAVTFRFRIDQPGPYTLLVRHDGDDLSLVARTPGGSVALPTGPAGPFRAVPLDLTAATYEVTASALGARGVFVDWELLLGGGVGLAGSLATSATSSSLIGAVAIPTTTAISAAPPAPAGSGAAPGAAGSAEVSAPVVVPAQGVAARLSGGLFGRDPSPNRAGPADRAEPGAAGPGTIADRAESPAAVLAGLDAALLTALQPALSHDATAEGVDSLWIRPASWIVPDESAVGPTDVAAEDRPGSATLEAAGVAPATDRDADADPSRSLSVPIALGSGTVGVVLGAAVVRATGVGSPRIAPYRPRSATGTTVAPTLLRSLMRRVG